MTKKEEKKDYYIFFEGGMLGPYSSHEALITANGLEGVVRYTLIRNPPFLKAQSPQLAVKEGKQTMPQLRPVYFGGQKHLNPDLILYV